MKQEKKRTIVVLPIEQWLFLKFQAAKDQTSMGRIVQDALEYYKKANKDKK